MIGLEDEVRDQSNSYKGIIKKEKKKKQKKMEKHKKGGILTNQLPVASCQLPNVSGSTKTYA